jgi:hypothetical protein
MQLVVARDRVRQPTGAALGIFIVFSNGWRIEKTKLARLAGLLGDMRPRETEALALNPSPTRHRPHDGARTATQP